MDQNASSDLDTGTLDGWSTPSLAPAILELDREVVISRTRETPA